MSNLQDIIINKRKELKLSLREAAKLIGISHSYLSTIEKGIDPRSGSPINPTPETLRLISKAYNMPYETLMQAAGYIDNESIDSNTKVSENKTKNIEQIEKEYKKEIEFLERFRQEMINRGFEYYKDKTHEELADIVVKHLKIQEILDGNNNKSN